ncbi:hypothetical protein QA600_13550 [Natronococcus sp. A-GB1]|nr:MULTISPECIES: hypothetical protein [Natronococcus]MDG5760361.1 hypothetical protein [Natronococcus sp. A-GB1]
MNDADPRDAMTDVPVDTAEPPLHLPGTPTTSFARTLERLYSRFLR